MKPAPFLITGHATFVNGHIHEVPVNTLYETLSDWGRDFVYIRHSIDGSQPSVAILYKGGVIIGEQRLRIVSRPAPLRYISEIIATFRFAKQYFKTPFTYIGVDPLNALAGVWLRQRGYARRAVFFTVDYSRTRFTSPVLNYCYHLIDRIVVRKSDAVWSVSSRIVAQRASMGLPAARNILVPNVPAVVPLRSVTKNASEQQQLVTLGLLSDQLDFSHLFRAIKKLAPDFPHLHLTIIGTGPAEEKYKGMVSRLGLLERVKFVGYQEHAAALKMIAASGIGLALYNGRWSFNQFGDSMKCREFFVYGLPVITTDTHATVEDIKEFGAGIITRQTTAAYMTAIREIIASYGQYSKAALSLAQRYQSIHQRLLKEEEER